MSLEIRQVEPLYEGYVSLMMATLAAPDGTTVRREIEHNGNGVAVLPYDPARRTVLLVSLPRAPVIWSGGPPELVEAIAGMIEGEDAQACARREALEEAGVRLAALEPVAQAWASPGVSSERLQLFLAAYSAADRVAQGGGVADEQENITVLELSAAELWARFEAGALQDMKTLALTLALRLRRPELFS